MPLSIGVNLRVTGHCNQGGRKYMEDMFSVAFQPTPDDKDLEYAFFGIFDGHGGGEAATFAKEHLMDIIVKQKNFWSDRDEDVLRAIRDGYVNTHYAMWRELDKWPRTASGLPSTAGTTASIAFIRKGKIYIGHVGDSGIILGYQVDGDPQWRAKALTKDHKPESGPEMIRIQESGGKVVSKSGVPRVVWNRPRIGHKGPVRRSTHIDEIPFLAVARSLGDLWSYNSELNTFVVSPEPDVKVVAVDVKSHRCLIFGTDGLWNMLTPQSAVAIVQAADKHNEKHVIASHQTSNGQSDLQMWINPSKSLVDRALERWSSTRLRADNTSVVTLMLDPPGLTRGEILLHQKKERVLIHHGIQTPASPTATEGMEKPISNLPSPSVSRLIEIVEPKQPDSSNVIDESIPVTLKPESTSCVEKSPSRKIESYYETKDVLIERSIEENIVDESIQVAEVSSSKILEETTEIEDKVLQTIDTVKSEKLESENQKVGIKKEDEAQSESLNVPVPVQSDCKKEPAEETTEVTETVDGSKTHNIMRQNAFSGTCEELKPHRTNRVRRSTGIIWERNNYTSDIELRSHILNGTRHKPLFPNSRDEVRTTKRSHSLSRQSQSSIAESGPSNSKPYVTVTSRLKLRNAKTSTANTIEETIRGAAKRGNTEGIGSKRRHSAISQSAPAAVEETCAVQEPCVKRRTRSEDRPSPTDENDPANQKVEDANSRLSWPAGESTFSRTAGASTTIPVQERLSSPNTFQRRSLGKKATPVKTIRRPSINGSSRLQQLRGRFGLRDWDQGRNNRSSSCNDRKMNRTVPIIGSTDATTMPQRWLRSDTIAAIQALRARDIDVSDQAISAQLIHQYGAAKQNRISLPAKLKQSTANGTLQSSRVKSSSLSSTKLKQTGNNSGNVGTCSTINTASTGSSSGSGIAKKVKSPYNPSARSLSTRSRIKRLGK